MEIKAELNYDIKLTYSAEWWRYFGEYHHLVELVFSSLKGGQITSVSLPLAFLIRHTLEIGYKMNLLELEKVSEIPVRINYKGKNAHKIDDLHKEFEDQMKAIFTKYNADKNIVKQFNNLNSKLISLKKLIHKLDELSYAFRYPVKNDGVTPNFNIPELDNKSDVINFKKIKELYDDSLKLIKYSTDVVSEIIKEHESKNS